MYSILFISSNLAGGGAERALLNLLNNLDRTKFTPYLALYQKQGAFLSDLQNDIEIYELQPDNAGFIKRNQIRVLNLLKVYKTVKPDLTMSIKWQVNVATLFTFKIVQRSSPIIINEQEPPKYSIDKRRRLLWPVFKFIYRLSDHIIVLSKEIASEIETEIKFDSSKITVLPNPLDIQGINQKAKLKETNQILKSPCILSIGRLTPEKNFPFLLRSFKLVLRSEQIDLYIMGEGKELTNLKQYCRTLGIDSRVHFLGFQTNPFAYLQKADLFVLPSKYEGFGNVLIEAMACGIPVIATECPYGPREILGDGKYGILTPLEDEGAMAQAIIDLLKHPEKQLNFSNQGKKRSQDFSIEKIIPQYQNLFLGVIEKHKSR